MAARSNDSRAEERERLRNGFGWSAQTPDDVMDMFMSFGESIGGFSPPDRGSEHG